MVATGLHHHRFLERPIVRVPITTLWQIGYTVKKCPPFGRPTLTNATKKEQYSTAPERARIRLGEEPRGFGVLGDGPYSARGRCRSDTFTYANSQSGNVGKPKATRSLDPIPAVLLHGSACLLWLESGHSITSSARARIEGGTVSPSALAVLRLTTSSKVVGCTTGRSAGLAPLRIFPA